MRLRPLSFAAIFSALLCAAIVILWIVTATSTRKIILLNQNPAIYAWRDGIGLRVVTAHAARSWEIDYVPVTLMTLLIPGIWIWRRLLACASHRESTSREAQELRKQISFLLPDAIAVYLMIGVTALAIYTRHPSAWMFATATNVALIANLVVRYRLKTRLKRLLTGRCAGCGYDLTGNVSGTCPECGSTSNLTA
jgi:hypothetical protein